MLAQQRGDGDDSSASCGLLAEGGRLLDPAADDADSNASTIALSQNGSASPSRRSSFLGIAPIGRVAVAMFSPGLLAASVKLVENARRCSGVLRG